MSKTLRYSHFVKQSASIRLLEFYEPITSLGKPAVGEFERPEVWSYIKRLKSEVKSSHQMLVKVVWPNQQFIYFLDLQCTCTQSRILAVHVSWSALQSRLTEQFFSTSRFTDTKNGRSRRHEYKLAPPPPSHPPYTKEMIFMFVGNPFCFRTKENNSIYSVPDSRMRIKLELCSFGKVSSLMGIPDIAFFWKLILFLFCYSQVAIKLSRIFPE